MLVQEAVPLAGEDDIQDALLLLADAYFVMFETTHVQSPRDSKEQLSKLDIAANALIGQMKTLGGGAYALLTGLHEAGQKAFQTQLDSLNHLASRARALSRGLDSVIAPGAKTANEPMLRECSLMLEQLGCLTIGDYPPKIARAIHETVTGAPLGEKSQMFDSTWERIYSGSSCR